MRRNYKIKKTISIKKFIEELGENFSEHIKNRLLDLEIRCVLTRDKSSRVLDIKHVEHTQYKIDDNSNQETIEKEYIYGQFIVNEDCLYFSKNCNENDKCIKSPIVDTIFDSLKNDSVEITEFLTGKEINDSNIDEIIDSILKVCPNVSKEYLKIVKHMKSLIS